MAETVNAKVTKILKGVRKGGTRFPQINLQKALEYSKRLVSKTHNGSQSEQTILVGVFNNKGSTGQVRASALKQYGLMEGDTEKGFVASQLARDIEGAVPEERPALIQKAFLTPRLFKQIYDTLQPDTVSHARVRQVVIAGNVHPDSADKCVACFIEGAIHARLGTLDGENIALTKASVVVAPAENGENAEDLDESLQQTEDESESGDMDAGSQPMNDGQHRRQPGGVPRTDVRVNLAVDSSSDPDKLEKQLKLLKQYGLLR